MTPGFLYSTVFRFTRLRTHDPVLKEVSMRQRWVLAAAVLLFTVTTDVAYAQTAQFLGSVKDDSGAVVPGATVIAKSEETGLSRTATTDVNGGYRLPALPPGRYSLTVELQGFSTEIRSGLLLIIDQ